MAKKIKIRKSPNTLLKKMFNLRLERVYPRSFERFAVSGNNLVGIEIGVYEGEHALSLLKNLDIKRLYLIDPYVINEDYKDIWKKNILKAKKKIHALFKNNRKVKLIYKYSSDALKDIDEKVDFVYVDGNHEYLSDKRYSIDSTKMGGLGWKQEIPFDEGLKSAVDWYQNNEDWWSVYN